MQDFATEEDVQAWVHSQPHGMGRLKLDLMLGERRLSERGMAVARRWLAGGEVAPQRIEPVLEPVLQVPVPTVALPPVAASAPAPAEAPPPLFPIRAVVVAAAVPASVEAPAAEARAEPAATASSNSAAPPAAVRRKKRFNWLEAIAIVLLLGVAAWLANELAHVAGRT